MKKFFREKFLGLKDVEVKGNVKVDTFKKRFAEAFGTEIRIYKTLTTGKGAKPADEKATLASICAKDKKVEDITIKKDKTVKEIEEQFKNEMGIGIQIMAPDGKTFADNDMKLKDVHKMEV
jgi:hypothetical protein